MQNCLKKHFSETDSLSALADTMKNSLAEQSRKALMFPAKYFFRSYDKQFGTNGASLFIFRVCLIGKHRILYAVLQMQNCLKKHFSETDVSCKIFF